jgi:hypothetical protein
MEKFNANERERAMGFHTNTIIVLSISKGAHTKIFG